MECPSCNFKKRYVMMTQACGNCKNCKKEISNSGYKFCAECSRENNECHWCGVKLTNDNKEIFITKLQECRDAQIEEYEKLLELKKELLD